MKRGATALDFAAYLGKLAIGGHDGSLAIYMLNKDQNGSCDSR
ncbi:MAG TPA: hypothetical protein VN541_11060 [Tepidisphaeraceae bacterium]|nr:hypothetical protein [Tepidisphaeraceae bacterium]